MKVPGSTVPFKILWRKMRHLPFLTKKISIHASKKRSLAIRTIALYLKTKGKTCLRWFFLPACPMTSSKSTAQCMASNWSRHVRIRMARIRAVFLLHFPIPISALNLCWCLVWKGRAAWCWTPATSSTHLLWIWRNSGSGRLNNYQGFVVEKIETLNNCIHF